MDRKASLTLGVALMALSAFAVFTAWKWPLKAALFPLVTAIPLFVFAAIEVAWVLFGAKHTPAPKVLGEDLDDAGEDELSARLVWQRTLLIAAWILFFFALIVFAGFKLAVPLFVFLYLRLEGRESWTLSLIFAAVVWGVFYGLFDRLLHVPFPQGWIMDWLGE